MIGGAKQTQGQTEDKTIQLGENQIRVVPADSKWKVIVIMLTAVGGIAFLVGFIGTPLHQMVMGPFAKYLAGMHAILKKAGIVAMAVAAAALGGAGYLGVKKLVPPPFDRWVKDIAAKRLSTKYIFFRGNMLFMHYDVSLNKKDIMEFITEISDKSERFTYYFTDIDINNYVCTMSVGKKKQIPRRATLDVNNDDKWNIIPLGEAVNHQLQDITPIGWWLNDNIKDERTVPTLPSTSILIAGGTGSGKSVAENCIIGHISRHSDRIQAVLADVKMVEFHGLESYKGIHKVALTVKEVEEALKQMQRIMMDRFSFMKDNGVNNVYKVDAEVDWFEIDGRKLQFDEIVACKVDGEDKILTMDQVYEAIEKGQDVEVDEKTLFDD